MAKTSYYIRKSSRKSDTGTIGIRIREGKYDLKVATPLTVQVAYWDASAPGYRDTTPVAVIDRKTRREFNHRLILLANFVEEHLTDKADYQTMKAIIEEFFETMSAKRKSHSLLPQKNVPKTEAWTSVKPSSFTSRRTHSAKGIRNRHITSSAR